MTHARSTHLDDDLADDDLANGPDAAAALRETAVEAAQASHEERIENARHARSVWPVRIGLRD